MWYAELTRIMAMGLIFGPPMPIAYSLSAISLFAMYLGDKYALLRVCKPPPQLGEALGDAFRNALSMLVLLNVGMQFLLAEYISPKKSWLEQWFFPWISLLCWGAMMLVPVRMLPFLR